MSTNTLWYKDAVIYQLHVKAFFDSDNSGVGDLAGLTSKLDYIESLGVTAIWLLPFYPSPLRDDGYAISGFTSVNPSYGNMRDFRRLVREAHRRGLRVITELVINHTSDQHPWFQRARRARPGSRWRNYYVWSDTDQKYAGTRIIFTDTEKSNWTWDPEAEAYYWHRFFSHQPDLNFDNPEVVDQVIRVMRHWLDAGVDGLRLDAIPYLCEREGTHNENLPETHQVLKGLRRALDERYEDKMLLAEANQWPEDVVPYFGDGDECHMAFNFPLMPRLYMAVAQEDRHPITDIIRQMPSIPETCQWAIFLRSGGPGPQRVLAAQLDAQAHQHPQGSRLFRPGNHPLLDARQPKGPGLHPGRRTGDDPLCPEPLEGPATGRAAAARIRRMGSHRALRSKPFPTHRAATVLHHPRRILEQEILPTYIGNRRWFGEKDNALTTIELALAAHPGSEPGRWMRTGFALGETGDVLRFSGTQALDAFPETTGDVPIERLGREQSNTSLLIGDRMILKAYRKLQAGVHPEIEVGRFLTERAGYEHAPAYCGSLEQVDAAGTPVALVVVHELIRNQGDGWSFTIDYLDRYLESAEGWTGDFADEEAPYLDYTQLAHTLGTRTAELHRAFSVATDDPAFRPEKIDARDLAAWSQGLARQAAAAREALEKTGGNASADVDERIGAVLGSWDAVESLARSLIPRDVDTLKSRYHGDYHLGQVMVAASDFYIIDFEGEPARPLAERRLKHSPLRDVAGMLRSFSYAASTGLFRVAARARPDVVEAVRPWVRRWEQAAKCAFLDGYRAAIGDCPSYPAEADTEQRLIDLFVLEKALYEIKYEAANRPSWLKIPLQGILDLLARREEGAQTR